MGLWRKQGPPPADMGPYSELCPRPPLGTQSSKLVRIKASLRNWGQQTECEPAASWVLWGPGHPQFSDALHCSPNIC